MFSSEPKLTRHELLAPTTHSGAHVLPRDKERPPFLAYAADQHVDVGMPGVVMINGHPLEAPAEIALYAVNELSRVSPKVELVAMLRRHNDLPKPRILFTLPGAESLLQVDLVALGVEPEPAVVFALGTLPREVAPVPIPASFLCVPGVGDLNHGAL